MDSPQETLFEIDGNPEAGSVPPRLSEQRRRTLRQRSVLTRGFHPLGLALGVNLPLHADAAEAGDSGSPGLRCGSCRFRQLVLWHDTKYPKCLFGATAQDAARPEGPPRASHGAGTDVRAWWPACQDHEYGDSAVSSDAARWTPERTEDGRGVEGRRGGA